MLTRKQLLLLFYLEEYTRRVGIAPSFEEMKKTLRLQSKSGIHRLVQALEERGFIRRIPNRARAIEILRVPGIMKEEAGLSEKGAGDGKLESENKGEEGEFPANVIRGSFSPGFGRRAASIGRSAISLPLYGRIAAGTPIEALRDPVQMIEAPADMIGQGEHYALSVEGNSMKDAGILDGDIVIVRHADVAENGDIVVALIDETEATLKRLRRKGESIALEPANPAYETRIFSTQAVRIQGVVEGLLRRF